MKRILLALALLAATKTIAQDIQLNTNYSLVGNSGSTSTQLLFWNGSNAYYGRKLSGMIGVNSHYFRIDGNTKLMINSAGNVGVGTITPLATLHVVRGSASWGTAAFDGTQRTSHFNYSTDEHTYIRGGKTNSHVFINDNGGYVGIGTTSPIRDLHLKKASIGGQVRFQIENTDNSNSSSHGIMSIYSGGANAGDAYLHLHPGDGSGEWAIGVDNSDNDKFKIGSNFFVGTASALTIDHNLNVGIGTSNPISELTLAQATNGLTIAGANPTTRLYESLEASVPASSGWEIQNFSSNNDRFRIIRRDAATISEKFAIDTNGNVGIGTADPKAKLSVNGNVRATEVKVMADISVPDYVFEKGYDLPTLQETKDYITANKHLPEIPSAAEIGENGFDLGDMNMRLLKKIEELTLHQIELLERLEQQSRELQQVKDKLERLDQ